jgi:guanylate kinase
MKGKLVIVSAPSGAGKTTIVNHLLDKGLDLEFSVSATTRKPRGKETHGKEYYFISVDDFRKRIKNNEFVEWEEVYKDQFYGTLKMEIERIWSHKKHVIFDVDVKGGISLKRVFGNRGVSLFIMPPSVKELEKRLLSRGTDKSDKVQERINKALEEMKLADKFDYIILNDHLKDATEEAESVVTSFLKR